MGVANIGQKSTFQLLTPYSITYITTAEITVQHFSNQPN